MILINGHWEFVETEEDCMRLIQEYIGKEFANAMSDIFARPEPNEQLKAALEEIDDAIGTAERAKELIEFLLN